MDPAFDPQRFEQRRLIDQIQEAQVLGRDSYVRTGDGQFALRIAPSDSAVLAVDSLASLGNIDLAAVEFSYEALKAPILASGTFVCVGSENRPEHFRQFLQGHPLESIGSVPELALLFDDEFGSGTDWRVYLGFLEALPEQLTEQTLENLIVPLLAAGELIWIPEEAAAILKTNGWSDERIQASVKPEVRDQRGAQSAFLYDTGVPASSIQSTNDLFDAISEVMARQGNYHAMHLICTFVRAHQFTANTDFIEQAVFPFLNSFGPHGYSAIIETLDNCRHASSANAPRYSGPAHPPFGEEAFN